MELMGIKEFSESRNIRKGRYQSALKALLD